MTNSTNPRTNTFTFIFHRGLFAAILFSLAVAIAPLHADDTMAQPSKAGDASHLNYLKAGKPDAIALLAPPPAPDSAEQAADLAEVRAVCHDAPSNDVAAAMIENKGVSLFYFTPVVGDIFQPGKLPKTEAFLRHVQAEAEAVVNSAKDYWKRPRPYMVDPGLVAGKLQKSFSYPSGHSTDSMTVGLVLADLFPDKRDAIIAEARAIGWHRVEIARHYPTDIYAGRVLAQAIVKEMKKNDAFQKDFEEAKAEIAAVKN
ncbi:MAG TPA: phosphatase PAP2 family protein [Dongiaceae bacterium]|jgi:acid phosphatase (class A)|nr:phosphatase PAP2 family protein [Dongiaceae bacterium]